MKGFNQLLRTEHRKTTFKCGSDYGVERKINLSPLINILKPGEHNGVHLKDVSKQ